MHWLTHLRRSLWARRLLGALGLGTAVALCPLPASGGLLWDIGVGVGYAALVGAATLYLYPLRGDGLPHRRLASLSQHRRTGWIALALGALHTALLLVAEPLSSRYLLPSAPLYMLSGIAALVALAILVPTGLSSRTALRRQPTAKAPASTAAAPAAPSSAPRAPPLSAITHAWLAALVLAFIAAHIAGSHQLIDSRIKTLTFCLLLAIPLAWTARRGLSPNRTSRTPTRATRLLTTTAPCYAAIALLALLPFPAATPRLLEPVTPPPILPTQFPHDKHTTVNCVTCHHNFVDRTGIGSCLDCHRHPRPDLTQSAEATFHTCCLDCHTQLAATATRHGPTRSCAACHLKPAATG